MALTKNKLGAYLCHKQTKRSKAENPVKSRQKNNYEKKKID